MDGSELLDPFNRLLEDIAAPERVRAIEAGGDAASMWAAFEESGFLDALVAEEKGGAGLSLAETEPLLEALGRHAVPLPVAETMAARALLAGAAVECPPGPIVLATAYEGRTAVVPIASCARHALIECAGEARLMPISALSAQATGAQRDGAAVLTLGGTAGPSFPIVHGGLKAVAAVLRAVAIAGAADRVLQMSIAYANERVQFGKPIGRQQAIQHQLAVMAEQTVAARLAAQIGCSGGLPPSEEAAAVAKISCSIAAPQVANIAHAVHGAIGISEEYDLQLFTRRLHGLRMADGSESYWARKLGGARLQSASDASVAFVRKIGSF
jgi:alkylation response protein AidB-like acyl-CoA dehydrogenase